MNDLVRRAQGDFVNHPITQVAINAMVFVATGGIDGVVAASQLLSKRIGSQTIYRVFGGEAQALGKS